jgi:hypothetical protein
LSLFVGRNVRRNKVNAMQLAALQRRPRQRQMPAMNRIERPAKEPYIHKIMVIALCSWNLASPPSVQIPGLRCKPNPIPIVRLALVLRANGHSEKPCSQNRNVLL